MPVNSHSDLDNFFKFHQTTTRLILAAVLAALLFLSTA